MDSERSAPSRGRLLDLPNRRIVEFPERELTPQEVSRIRELLINRQHGFMPRKIP